MSQKSSTPGERLDAFVVDEFEVDGQMRSSWSKVGTAWPQKGGYRVVLKAVPVDGVLILHAPKPKDD